MPHPGHFTHGKETWYPLDRRLGGPQGWSGQLWKISPPPGFDSWTVHPVVSRYTDYAILAHFGALTALLMKIIAFWDMTVLL